MIMAQPILPDPYAANWRVPDDNQVQDGALSVTLDWAALRRRASWPALSPHPVP